MRWAFSLAAQESRTADRTGLLSTDNNTCYLSKLLCVSKITHIRWVSQTEVSDWHLDEHVIYMLRCSSFCHRLPVLCKEKSYNTNDVYCYTILELNTFAGDHCGLVA